MLFKRKPSLLEQCLEAARCLDQQFGGMASIDVQYHPYESHWIAKASWSSGKTIGIVKENVDEAMKLLLGQLHITREKGR